MNRKFQVFVSSTFKDMIDERGAAIEAILRARHIPAGMEMFAAGNKSQWETIKRWIDDSDVYVLILGGRYGTVEPESGKSYIHLEYEYAVSRDKPFFALISQESYNESKVQRLGSHFGEEENPQGLADFRNEVTQRICRFFDNTEQIKSAILESLFDFERQDSLAGWVRSQEVVALNEMMSEVTRLRSEIIRLRSELNKAEVVSGDALKQDEAARLEKTLTTDAKALLVKACAGDGSIRHETWDRWSNGFLLIGGQNFTLNLSQNKTKVCWETCVHELKNNGYLHGRHITHHASHLGYRVAAIAAPNIPDLVDLLEPPAT